MPVTLRGPLGIPRVVCKSPDSFTIFESQIRRVKHCERYHTRRETYQNRRRLAVARSFGGGEQPSTGQQHFPLRQTHVDSIPPELVDTNPRAIPVARL